MSTCTCTYSGHVTQKCVVLVLGGTAHDFYWDGVHVVHVVHNLIKWGAGSEHRAWSQQPRTFWAKNCMVPSQGRGCKVEAIPAVELEPEPLNIYILIPFLPLGPAKSWIDLWFFQRCTVLIVENWRKFKSTRVQEAHSLIGNSLEITAESQDRRVHDANPRIFGQRELKQQNSSKFSIKLCTLWKSHIWEGRHCCPSIRMIFPLHMAYFNCQVSLPPMVCHVDRFSSDLAPMPHWQQLPHSHR